MTQTIKELIFEVTLKTDIILNQKAATEGNQQTLDFIPGNNFLGIVAKSYKEFDDSLMVFHRNKVRFGDAHPVNEEGERALRIPASFYHAKMKGKPEILVHHQIPKGKNDEIHQFEPKQYRSGFYYIQNPAEEQTPLYKVEAKIDKSFAIKSAYDREARRSREGQMYGYESLQKDSRWRFSVFVDQDVDDKTTEKIKNKLTGTHTIGRSRTAQYGLIQIESVDEKDYTSASIEGKEFVLVYADARLIFLDDNGLPTFQPKAEDLGFKNGQIDWRNSQLRFFQYAPWNGQRKARDTDRCGIEKGSVFFVEKKEKDMPLMYTGNDFVGYYQNEGFGKVIIDPEFLATKADSQIGESRYFINEEKKEDNTKSNENQRKSEVPKDPVFKFLLQKQQQENTKTKIYELVNSFKNDHKKAFSKEVFASQWGTIRSMAMQGKTDDQILDYTSKGVAKDKWDENGRRDKLKKFFESIKALDSKDQQSAIINLASEMAKICKGGN